MTDLVALSEMEIKHLIDPECEICRESLTEDSIQMRCCSQIYHRSCVFEWVRHMSLDTFESDVANCMHCNVVMKGFSWPDIQSAATTSWETRREAAQQRAYLMHYFSMLSTKTAMKFMTYIREKWMVYSHAGCTSPKDGKYRRKLIKEARHEEKPIVEELLEHRDSLRNLMYWWSCLPRDTRDMLQTTKEEHDLIKLPLVYGEFDGSFVANIATRLFR